MLSRNLTSLVWTEVFQLRYFGQGGLLSLSLSLSLPQSLYLCLGGCCEPRWYCLVLELVTFSSQSIRPRFRTDVSQTAHQLLVALRLYSLHTLHRILLHTVALRQLTALSPFSDCSPPLPLLCVSRLSRPYAVGSGGRGMLHSSAASQPVQFIHSGECLLVGSNSIISV